jgi:endonuclease/exonuclease/phosphatase family metal-dependent hydrolase
MTRILSYNILVGGKNRLDKIEQMIRQADPDVVGLVEATNQEVVKELAGRLGMDYRVNALPDNPWQPELALLSRLPIVSSTIHPHPAMRAHALLEVCLEEANGEKLTVFVTHLTADFFRGRGGDAPRRKEVQAILDSMRANHSPHVLIGDFNALAPTDTLKASNLLRYLVELEKRLKKSSPAARKGHPTLNYVLPPRLRFLRPVLRLVAQNRFLSVLFDGVGSLYAPRGSIALLRAAGYVDCFRYINPRAWGFTCPAAAPAGRIDYLFANPALATRLSACKVINGGAEIEAPQASDHLPVMAEFGTAVTMPWHVRREIPVEAGVEYA